MRFRVALTHLRGVQRPKRDIAQADGPVGDVTTCYQPDPFTRRTVMVATFEDENPNIDLRVMLPGLFDARCALIVSGGMMLVGVERIQIDGVLVQYAQGWWMWPEHEVSHGDSRKVNGINAPTGTREENRSR